MAQNFTAGRFEARDLTGAVLAGGYVYTYARGTTALQASYTDYTLTTPNTNPVVLDESGRAAIWLDPSLQYTVKVVSANGTTQYTEALDNSALSGISFVGTWNASTNVPTLADTTGQPDTYFIVTTGGTRNLGSGSIVWEQGDEVRYTGATAGSGVYARVPQVTATSASAIVVTPAGGISAETAQAALEELDTEKAPKASPTFTGKATTAASATGGAGLNLPPGVAPTSPVNGDVWGTSSGLFARVAGATQPIGNFTASGTGAAVRTQQDKSRDIVSVNDFGAAGNGTTDDTTAFSNALTSLGDLGGIVYYNKRCLLDDNLTLPANCGIKGPFVIPGLPKDNYGDNDFWNKAALLLNETKTITLSANSGLDGCLVLRKGITSRPTSPDDFAGTAITSLGDFVGDDSFDDTFVRNSMILGFEYGIYMTGNSRPRIRDCNIDCLNGIYIEECLDVAYIDSVHCWPFLTIGGEGVGYSNNRNGTAIKLAGVGDWSKITNCFAYGYLRAFNINDSDDSHLINCGADNIGGSGTFYPSSIGYLIDGSAERTRMIGCIAAAHTTGVYFNVTSGSEPVLDMVSCNIRVNQDHGVVVEKGNLRFHGGNISNTANGISVVDASSVIHVGGCRFHTITNAPINLLVTTTNVYLSDDIDYGNWTGAVISGTRGIPTVASASTVTISPSDNFVAISGTTDFSLMNYGWTGRKVTLLFTAALTVSNSVSSGGFALNNDSFRAGSGATLTVVSNGSRWVEVGRSNGAKKRALGTISITAGATDGSAAHGMIATPTVCSITPRGANLGGTSFWYGADATNVTVYIGAAQAGTTFYDYVAEYV